VIAASGVKDPSRPVFDLVIVADQVVTPNGTVAAEIGVVGGVIVAIDPSGSCLTGRSRVMLTADEILIPGLVDTHVHVNEPGRTEWEGFASATRAAAAGGVTTIIDMPLNSIPPTVSIEALSVKRSSAQQNVFVDVGFWGGAIPGNKAELGALWSDDVFGFKCFLLNSGVDEFPPLTVRELEEYLAELVQFDSLMLVHAEDSITIELAANGGGETYEAFLESRPRSAENVAIADVIEAAKRTGARVHVLHLSSSDALPMIAAARVDGVSITVETCPHYLTLAAENIPNGATAYKCCPPIREESNRELLWQALEDGTIDCIVSDHSPSTVELKQPADGDFTAAWGGISSLQLGISLVWTEARRRGISLDRVSDWMSARTASLAGLSSKGRIALGLDADFAVFAPDETFMVKVAALHHKNPVSPYDGLTLAGVVRATYLRGELIDLASPSGKLLRRRH
jgi:allantoinase